MPSLRYLQFQGSFSEISFVDLFHSELSKVLVLFSSVDITIGVLLIAFLLSSLSLEGVR